MNVLKGNIFYNYKMSQEFVKNVQKKQQFVMEVQTLDLNLDIGEKTTTQNIFKNV